MKNIMLALFFIIVVIIVAGIYKFNILNDDIYMQTDSGAVVKINEFDERRAVFEKTAYSYAQTAQIYVEDGYNLRLKKEQSFACDSCFDYEFDHYGDPGIVYELSVMVDKDGSPSWFERNKQSSEYYLCDENQVAEFSFVDSTKEVIKLYFSEQEWLLRIQRTASGNKFSNGKVSFWLKGDEAMLFLNGDSNFLRCQRK